jgi:radial spoke head protein 4A
MLTEEQKNGEIKKKGEEKILYNENEHMRELIKEIVTSHQQDGYDKFEKISMFLREKNTKLDNFQYTHPEKIIKNIINITPLEKKIILEEIKKSDRPIKQLNNYMEDIIAQSELLEWGGISFNDIEWYKIRTALKKLLVENNCEFIRFFGKIYGINSDYYIIQGLPRNYPMKNPPIHVESKGNEGINRYTFWVSNSPLEYWYELPDITPEQLVTSRKFKYYFTGNLNSKVKSFISFPGKEMHLLKCQIVRILHSSCIVPKGYLKISENFKEQLEGKISEYDEEFKSPSFEEMKAPEGENWVHEHAYIFPNGKIIDPSIETQVERMKGIGEDEGYKIKEGEGEEVQETDVKFWKIKIFGDQMSYVIPEKDPVTHAVIHIENERWPGTHTVWKEGQFCNIYIGFGVKNVDECYYPTQLEKIDKDPEDVNEHSEPNPEKEPVIPEPDSDEEKKEEGENNEE